MAGQVYIKAIVASEPEDKSMFVTDNAEQPVYSEWTLSDVEDDASMFESIAEALTFLVEHEDEIVLQSKEVPVVYVFEDAEDNG